MRNDPLCGETRLQKLIPVVERLTSELDEPLDFDCPRFVVNTDDGSQPTLETIIAQIDDLYSRPDIHDLDRASHVAE
jgi:hypothetical protein